MRKTLAIFLMTLLMRKINRIFFFLLTLLLISGFNPIPAWSEPYQTDQNTDGSNLSIDQSIRNSERVSDFITLIDYGGVGISPLSGDVTVHAGDNSVTITGTVRTRDLNIFSVALSDDTGNLLLSAMYE